LCSALILFADDTTYDSATTIQARHGLKILHLRLAGRLRRSLGGRARGRVREPIWITSPRHPRYPNAPTCASAAG